MVNGLYASGEGMRGRALRQDLTANALANASTPGFRQQRLTLEARTDSRADLEGYWRSRTVQTGHATVTELTHGPLVQTGNPLDLALRGDGWLGLQTPNGERWTRTVEARRTNDGLLVDASGTPLLSADGEPVRVGEGLLSVLADGRILEDGEEAARLRVVEFPPGTPMQPEGRGRYRPEPDAGGVIPQPSPSVTTAVESGHLERSNADAIGLMVRMMAGFRNYEANARALQAVDSTLDRAVNQVGRV